jgi:hypothetical protein
MEAAVGIPPLEDHNAWADVWRYEVGINLIPAITQKKKITVEWKRWQTESIPDELHEKWKRENAFADGMAIILGKVWRGDHIGEYLVFVDLDNLKAIEEFCTRNNKKTVPLKEIAEQFIVEQHPDDTNKAHVLFYSEIPFTKKSSDVSIFHRKNFEDIPAIEVKGNVGHGIVFCTPSVHKNGQRYQILGTIRPIKLSEDMAKETMEHIDDICRRYGLQYLANDNNKAAGNSLVPTKDLFKDEFVIYENHNRHLGLLRAMDSLIKRNYAILSLEEIKEIAQNWNQKHCIPPKDKREFNKDWKEATKYIANKIREEQQQGQQKTSSIPKASAPKVPMATKAPTQELLLDPLTKGNDYYEFLIECSKKTVKEENALVRKIHYTLLSAYTPEPINLASIAPTSTGKTYPTLECAKYGVSKDIRIVGSMTPRVLVREHGVLVDKNMQPIGQQVSELKVAIKKANSQKKFEEAEDLKTELNLLLDGSAYILDLTNRTLLFLEPPRPELWELVKPILSHDSWEMEHPFVDKVASGMEVKRVITRGFPACIFCSAKDESKYEGWPEIASRFLVESPNMIRPKFQAGNKLIAQKKGLPNAVKPSVIISDKEKKLAQQCFVQLKTQIQQTIQECGPDPVWIPYAEILADALPSNKGTDNRTTGRLFAILVMSALCKAHLRPRLVFAGQTQIIATFDDLREALYLIQNVTGIPPHKIRFYQDYIVPLYTRKKHEASSITGSEEEEEEVHLTSREIADYYNEHVQAKEGGATGPVSKLNTDSVTRIFLNELVNNDYLEKDELQQGRSKYVYIPLVLDADKNESTFSPQKGHCGDNLQVSKLQLPDSYKEIPKDWLKVEIKRVKHYRKDNPDFRIFGKVLDEKEITINKFIKQYTKSQNLADFFKISPSAVATLQEEK